MLRFKQRAKDQISVFWASFAGELYRVLIMLEHM